ncbi:MAG TPA: hypothetical protein VFA10_08945 [Ktedonobacteraceae bacterium]|nr:hypothetical protein [Ktedonobacteraceae bacterium]
MSIPAFDNIQKPSDPIRKGVHVHYVASEKEQHKLVVISEAVKDSPTDEVMLQINDPTRSHGRYSTHAHFDEGHQVGTWHWTEQE